MLRGLWQKWRGGEPDPAERSHQDTAASQPADRVPANADAKANGDADAEPLSATTPAPAAPEPAWEANTAAPPAAPSSPEQVPVQVAAPAPAAPMAPATAPQHGGPELMVDGRRYAFTQLPADLRELVRAIAAADERIRFRQGTIQVLTAGRTALARRLQERLQGIPPLGEP